MKSESELVKLAAELARSAHEGQFRRDGTIPYIVHPQEVAAAMRGNAIAEAIAWLHDVVEQTSVDAETLRLRGIPENVIRSVLLLTHHEGFDYEAYILSIKACPTAAKIKVADIISNLSEHPSHQEMIQYAKAILTLLT